MKDETAKVIVQALKKCGINFVASLPELQLLPLINAVSADGDFIHVRVAREDEGIGICAGAWLCGKRTAMIMMNTGFLMCGNALTSMNYIHGIPNLLLIGYTGGLGEPFWFHTSLAKVTEPVLKAMGITYDIATRVSEVKDVIRGAAILAESSKQQVAVLLVKEALRG